MTMHIDDVLDDTRDTADPSAETLQRAGLRSLTAAQESVDRITHIARARTRRRRTAGVLTVAASAAVAVVVIAPWSGDTPAPAAQAPTTHTATPTSAATPQFRNAAQVLRAAGTSSAAQVVDVAHATYWRVDSEYEQGHDGVFRRTFWQGHTSTGYLFDEGFGDEGLVKMGVAKFSFQQQSLTWDQLLHLTTSKSELLRLLRAGTGDLKGGSPDHYAFKTLGEMLAETPAPPAVRKAMWDAAAELTGVTNDGEVKDAKGRSGYGITLGAMTYVVEPSTGRILESRMKLEDGLTYRMTYLSAGPTDATPSVPNAAS
jgi:hypothetical protein